MICDGLAWEAGEAALLSVTAGFSDGTPPAAAGLPNGALQGLEASSDADAGSEASSAFACSQSTAPSCSEELGEAWEELLTLDELCRTPRAASALAEASGAAGAWAREMSVAEFYHAAAATRRRLPPLADAVPSLRALCDGLAWDAAEAGRHLAPGCFVRVAASPLAISERWEFLAKVRAQHSESHWRVDLGADYDQYYFVDGKWLHLIQYDLNVPGVVEDYPRCRALSGHLTSRRLGADGRPRAD